MVINIKGNYPTLLDSVVQIVPECGALYFIEKQMKHLLMKQQK